MSKPTIGQSSRSVLDLDTNDTFNFDANFTPAHVEPLTSMVANTPSHLSFSAPGYVVYSSDVDVTPTHVPFVAMAAGAGGGTSGGGTTTTTSSTLVTDGSGTGLSINVIWDASVGSAPSRRGGRRVISKTTQLKRDWFVTQWTGNGAVRVSEQATVFCVRRP